MIAYDDVAGDLYAGTDFGPLVLRSGTGHWEAVGVGFPESLMVDLRIDPERRLLVAATHGLGIFYLDLSSASPGWSAGSSDPARSPGLKTRGSIR